MSNGILVLAQNNDNTNYVLQACLLAMSIKVTNTDTLISIVTNDIVPDEYITLFDKIIPIPFNDNAIESSWKIENRWKLYHATPYEHTLVMDTDMLVTKNISSWWNFLKNYDLFFVSNPKTYRNEVVTSDFYRKSFTSNNLPNLYTGMHYFKKSEFAYDFYKWMEIITYNWELFYGNFVKIDYPKHASMDITAAIAAKILNCEHLITSKTNQNISFVHMKSNVQNWTLPTDSWQRKVSYFIDTNCNLKVGNFIQTEVFHYTEKDFLNKNIIDAYRKKLNV
jgi:hypothetical protein